MVKKRYNYVSPVFVLAVLLATVSTVLFAASASALTDTTAPAIQAVSPINNVEDTSVHKQISVEFTEPMNPSTINENTFLVMQRTTPTSGAYRSLPVDGEIVLSGRTATFTPNEKLSPNQEYGNVFTVTVTTGAQDLAGNGLVQDYVWSFTTGTNQFNTGASTAQTFQSASPPIEDSQPVATVPVTPATTSPQTSAANTFPWLWIVGGIGVLVLLVLLVMMIFRMSTSEKTLVKTVHRPSRSNPFGDVHPVEDLEGIGPVYGKALKAMGITDTRQLWTASAKTIARKTGAPLASVQSWQNMAELASVNSIGPQYAELLERSGIHTIAQLRVAKPKALLTLVQKKEGSLDVSIQGNTLGKSTVSHWIHSARDHAYTEDVREGQTA